ncbi:MAG: sigma-54-dependent Fis family transcriptional regulator [Deltaproteobacteria bacterium]|nr:MAG: sigma-54-dependent Fis family transcriptional regulator [Deltaproteobacteria bacterium]
MGEILIVDDEPSLRDMLALALEERGHVVREAAGVQQARRALAGGRVDLVLTDLKMPDGSGLEVLEYARGRDGSTQVILMTGYATADTAVEAMKRGALDYLTKPFPSMNALLAQVEKALEVSRLAQDNLALREALSERRGFGDLVGRSATMKRLYELVGRIAPTRTTVLITGESGTGKELLARAIHRTSDRAAAPFVPVNCGAIPETLIESELFGHVKGAFTGAQAAREGLFRSAHGGTLFLDEVGELPPATQVKLLRVLQERTVKRVGAEREEEVDCRVLAATNRDLREQVESGAFREDLYYRLNVIELRVPPLRDRREDIPLLARHFVQRFAAEMGRDITDIAPDAMEALLAHRFPGNVRELENLMERAVTLELDRRVTLASLPPTLQARGGGSAPTPLLLPDAGVSLDAVLAEVEQNLLRQALERTGGNRTEAARLLGITFRSMRYRLAKHDMDDDDTPGQDP